MNQTGWDALRYGLSIRLYQRPPLTPLTSADTIRSVHTEASIQLSLRTSAPCVALAGTAGVFCAFVSDIAFPPSYPPSLGVVLLPTLSAAHHGCGTMRALTPAAPRQCDRPLRSICLAFRASNPQPRCALARHVPYHPRAYNRFLAVPGFATHPAGSPLRPAETGSLSCRLLVRTPAAPHPALGRDTITPLCGCSCLRLHVR